MASDNDAIGESVKRTEGRQFVDGSAEYIDDVQNPRHLHVAFVRSLHSHAEIVDVDIDEALAMDGVEAVLTGADLEERTTRKGHWVMGWPAGDEYGLAVDRVRYYGEPIVAIAAEDKYLAEDAAEKVRIDYDPLEPVVDAERATDEDAPLVHPELQDREEIDGNVADTATLQAGDVASGFDRADHILERRFEAPAINGAPMETHGCIADYDRASDSIELRTSTQLIHQIKGFLADVLGMPSNKVSVTREEIGGGFGNKLNLLSHEICSAVLSEELNRPVKAKLGRQEQLEISKSSFNYVVELKMGVTDEGDITAVEGDVIQDEGAYHSWGHAIIAFALNTAVSLPYKIPNLDVGGEVVYTNRTPAAPVRGTGVRQIAMARELLVSEAAEEIGIDPLELRKRNLVTKDDCPYTASTGNVIHSTGIKEAIDTMTDAIDYESVREELADEEYAGIGLACSLHISSGRETDADFGSINLRFEEDGSLTLQTDACDMGTGCRTTLSQIVADRVGTETDGIVVEDDSTETTPQGMGSWGSRTMAIMGTATLQAADALAEKLRRIAAEQLETTPEDIELRAGEAAVAGTDRSIGLADIAGLAYHVGTALPDGMTAGPINHEITFDSGDPELPYPTEVVDEDGIGNLSISYPSSCQIATASVDPDTGKATIDEYVVADDVGKAINPQIVEGQVHGGAAQAVGFVLGEKLEYDDSGQLMNSNFSEYAIPTAKDVPDIETHIVEEPDVNGPGGWKGMGEGPIITGVSALANAVCDAADHRFTGIPLDPETVREPFREE